MESPLFSKAIGTSVGFLSVSSNALQLKIDPPDSASSWNRAKGQHSVKSMSFDDTCTEILGCETGALRSAHEHSLITAAAMNSTYYKKTKTSSPPLFKELPPPLTTQRDGQLFLLRKREKGRLLLIPFRPLALEAKRSGGRLWLRFRQRKTHELGKAEEEEEECSVFGGGSGMYRRCTREGEATIFSCEAFCVASS